MTSTEPGHSADARCDASPASASEPAPDPRRRPLRWPWWCLAGAAACLTTQQLLLGTDLLVLGIDTRGWTFLLRLCVGVLVLCAVAGLAHAITRGSDALWALAVRCVAILAIGAVCLGGGWAAMLLGAVSLSDEYRVIGVVDGRQVIVRLDPGWDEDGDVSVGFLDGVQLDLRVGGSAVVEYAPPLDGWRFRTTASRTAVRVRYTGGANRGVLTLPRRR